MGINLSSYCYQHNYWIFVEKVRICSLLMSKARNNLVMIVLTGKLPTFYKYNQGWCLENRKLGMHLQQKWQFCYKYLYMNPNLRKKKLYYGMLTAKLPPFSNKRLGGLLIPFANCKNTTLRYRNLGMVLESLILTAVISVFFPLFNAKIALC